jgi:hypothetical protein
VLLCGATLAVKSDGKVKDRASWQAGRSRER